jgi:hypothetical protein
MLHTVLSLQHKDELFVNIKAVMEDASEKAGRPSRLRVEHEVKVVMGW